MQLRPSLGQQQVQLRKSAEDCTICTCNWESCKQKARRGNSCERSGEVAENLAIWKLWKVSISWEQLHQNIAKVRKVDICGCKILTFCNYRERLESCENCSCDMTSRCILGWHLCIGLPPPSAECIIVKPHTQTDTPCMHTCTHKLTAMNTNINTISCVHLHTLFVHTLPWASIHTVFLWVRVLERALDQISNHHKVKID